MLPFLWETVEKMGQQVQGLKQTIQSEFMPGHGVKAALITFMDDFQHDLNDYGISLLVLLDLSAALDAVNHRIFLDSLQQLEIRGIILQWFCCFLSRWFQSEVEGGEVKSWAVQWKELAHFFLTST